MHYQQKIPVQEAFTTKQAHITWVSVGGLTAERFTLPHLFLPLPVTTICFCDTTRYVIIWVWSTLISRCGFRYFPPTRAFNPTIRNFLDPPLPVEEPTVATSDPVQLDTDEETDPEPAVDTDSKDEYETGDPCSPAR